MLIWCAPVATSDHRLQGCVKLLAALLRACPEYAPPVSQLRDIVAWAFADLTDAAARPQLFSLLKAILDRKLVAVAEVHGVMTRLQVRRNLSAICNTVRPSTLVPSLHALTSEIPGRPTRTHHMHYCPGTTYNQHYP